jgi:glutamyl-Q tRNA(Asp) synthetase
MNPSIYRGRFAPSPTGLLHFGSLVSAVASHADARYHGGEWLLRIDDLDQVRNVAGMDAHFLRALDAFGMHWDATPTRQSEHQAQYREALKALRVSGYTYVCRCSRKAIRDHAKYGLEGPVYPGTCRDLNLEDAPRRAIRLRTEDREISFEDRVFGGQTQNLQRDIGDFVIRRADGFAAYQLAVVIDDHLSGVTDIVRGADLLLSTPRQILLHHLLGFSIPRYLHVPLVVGWDGKKLSKRDAAHPVDERSPLAGLLAAWTFLGQIPPQGSDRPAQVAEFWEWAIPRWAPKAMRVHQESP